MGKLRPYCLATNAQGIYVLSAGRNHSANEQDFAAEMWILLKSQPYPTDLNAITWSVVSTIPRTQLPILPQRETNKYSNIRQMECMVDDSGAFTFSQIPNGLILVAQYDSAAAMIPGSKTTHAASTPLGEWSALIPDRVGAFDGVTKSWLWNVQDPGRNGTRRILVSGTLGTKPYSSHPIMTTSLLGTKAPNVNRFSHNLDARETGGLSTFAYGNGNIYAVLETGPASPAPPLLFGELQYKRTLRVFPVNSTADLSSPLKLGFELPWDLNCGATTIRERLGVAGGGNFYYLCKVPGDGSYDDPYQLYVLEGRTPRLILTGSRNSLQASLALVHADATNSLPPQPPLFALWSDGETEFEPIQWVDLRSSKPEWSVMPDITVPESIRTFVYVPTAEESCYEACTFGKGVTIILAVVGSVAFFLLVFIVWWCRKRRARRREVEGR